MPRLNTAKALTQRVIDTTPRPASGIKELRERGLLIRFFPSGSCTFSLEYRSPVTGKSGRLALSATNLTEARAAIVKHKATLGEGRDPAMEAKEALQARRVEHARAVTVADAVDKYEPVFIADGGDKAASRRDRMLRLRRYLAPLAWRSVASLTRGELIARLDELQVDSGPITRNRAQAEMRAWLKFCSDRDYVPAIVLAGVSKAINEKPRERTRVLSDAEVGAMLAATMDGSPFSDVVRVLLHTGMRKGEVANLQSRDLNFDERTIMVRAAVSKNGRERIIPMADAIAPMLEARAEGLKREQFIFGEGSGFGAPMSGWDKATDRLRAQMPEGDHWTLHDIRRTVVTRLTDAGVEKLVVEDLVGHVSGDRAGVAGVYNRSITLSRQTLAVRDWAARLAGLIGNVVPLRRRAV
jgi:integrase